MSSPPKYLFKILPTAPPDPLPPQLPTTPLDAQDGFIHLSTAQQTPHTAHLFFGSQTRLWILKLETAALDGRLEYMIDSRAGVVDGAAHVHDSVAGLGSGNVKAVVVVHRAEGEGWRDVAQWTELERE